MNKLVAAAALTSAALLSSQASAQLVLGTGDFTNDVADNDVFLVDVASNTSSVLFSANIFGMTAVSADTLVYTDADETLFSFTIGGSGPVAIGQTGVGGNDRVDGLAFSNGILYGWQQFGDTAAGSLAGLYEIDLTTGARTFSGGDLADDGAISGIDADPSTGIIYGVSDTDEEIVVIDPTTGFTSTLAAYPAGAIDIDGLAAGPGTLYLVEDEDAPIQIFDIASGTFSGTLDSPFGTADTFSGAAFLIPEPASLGLFGLAGLALVRRRQ
ncbi:MAG: PEP-CTERM sorting domain-containing protein [Planctomycetota bacterium]